MSDDDIKKEISLELAGINGLDPYLEHSTAPRKAMFATQIGQVPVPEGAEIPSILTGMELELAKTTFNIKFPKDCTVLGVVRRYPVGVGRDAIKHNPVTTIIYEDYYCPKKTIGVIHVPEFNALHQDFGYPLVKTDNFRNITIGSRFEKGDVLAESPAVHATPNGNIYGISVNVNVAYLSHPATIEDGFVVSESASKRFTPTIYNKIRAGWGRKSFPLNIYGDENHYKPFPDVGEPIRDDGIVMVLRDFDENLAVANMSPRALMEVDGIFDKPIYGKPGAIIKDINVFFDDRLNPAYTPTGMEEQPKKYYDALCNYYKTFVDEYNRIRKRRGGKVSITPEFQSLLVEAQYHLPTPMSQRKLTRMYRLELLDEWDVEITYEEKLQTGEGNKLSCFWGGKGVNCRNEPDENMPVDKHGNRADVIVYGASTFGRSNYGRFYAQFFNATRRDLVHRLRKEAGFVDFNRKFTLKELSVLDKNPEFVRYAWQELLEFYSIIVPLQYEGLKNDPDPLSRVKLTLQSEGFLYSPPDNPVNNYDVASKIRYSRFCPLYDKVEFTDIVGIRRESEVPVLIGEMPFIFLEKTGEDCSAVASAKTQSLGVIAKLNNFDRNTTPIRQASVRAAGESETRNYISTIGPDATMKILELSNNPTTHEAHCENILDAEYPSNMEHCVDWSIHPLGGSRPVKFTGHVLRCRGMEMVRDVDLENTVTEAN